MLKPLLKQAVNKLQTMLMQTDDFSHAFFPPETDLSVLINAADIPAKIRLNKDTPYLDDTGSEKDSDSQSGGRYFTLMIVRVHPSETKYSQNIAENPVNTMAERLGVLFAFDQQLGGQWELPGFVPPVTDQKIREQIKQMYYPQLCQLNESLIRFDKEAALLSLETEYKSIKTLVAKRLEILNALLSIKKQIRKFLREKLRQFSDDALFNYDDIAPLLKFFSVSAQKNSETYSTALLSKARLLHVLSLQSQTDKKRRKKWIKAGERQQQPLLDKLNQLNQQRRQITGQIDKQLDLWKTALLKSVTLPLPANSPLNDTAEDGAISLHQIYSKHFTDSPENTGIHAEKTGQSWDGWECATTKLFHYALKHQLTPLAVTGIWQGASPAYHIRHHNNFYLPCRGRCQPVMNTVYGHAPDNILFAAQTIFIADADVEWIFEDEDILVIHKPAGLLSVPGKTQHDSVYSRVQDIYPHLSSPLIVHRLDLATSGLMVLAKNKSSHKLLQHAFAGRRVKKRYIAILSQPLSLKGSSNQADEKVSANLSGIIDLPLCNDIYDRPRQMVHYSRGKPALTHWQLDTQSDTNSQHPRVWFYPQTGRTHQLRMHAAHPSGLGAPILGDALYSDLTINHAFKPERMYLHADQLQFSHPRSKKWQIFEKPAEF